MQRFHSRTLVLGFLLASSLRLAAAGLMGDPGLGVPPVAIAGRLKALEPPGSVQPGVAPLGPALLGMAPDQAALCPPLSAQEFARLQQPRLPDSKGRLQIGLHRPLQQLLRVDSTSVPSSHWTVLPNGWRLYSLAVTSPGALGLRAHLEAVRLPPGARLVAYDPARPAPQVTPLTAAELSGGSELWSETVFAERAIIECQVPPEADLNAVAFSLSGVSHLYQLPLSPGLAKATSCNNDVSCFADWSSQAAGTARLLLVDSGNTYLCSGCLLNANDPNNLVDYFLTAHHCIGDQTVAATLECYWFYQTSACNGAPPALANVPHTSGGADFLAGSPANDFAFLRLRRAPPAGVFYLGWSLATPPADETLATIHHPNASFKRISFGHSLGTDGAFWNVRWFSGVTEPGSSGGPLCNASHQVIGQLYGGASSCTEPSGIDTYGRFDISFKSLQPWLSPASQALVTPVKGSYSGLFEPAQPSPVGTSGLLSLSSTAKGRFSASLLLGATRYPLSGRFGPDGSAQLTLTRRALSPLQISLQLNPSDTDQLSGSLSDGSFSATLQANRAVFDAKANPAPQAGRYTLAMAGAADNASTQPAGDSYGLMVVSRAGLVQLSAWLADGSQLSRSAPLSKDGQWPLYTPLYAGRGLLSGWINLSASAPAPSGQLTWSKPQMPRSKLYPGGFTALASVSGSPYKAPAKATPILNLPAALLQLRGGGLSQDIVNNVLLRPNNRLQNLSSNALSLSFSTANGLFQGRVVNPLTAKPIAFNGVVLQTQNQACGFFLGPQLSGRVLLEAAPP